MMKVETMSKQIIKPSATTPNDLRTLQLSIHDHIISPVYTTAFLFYTNDDLISQDHISHKLKTSLSETLTKFYPFAGRINGVTVDCNDEGAVFVEARVDDCPLSDLIRSPDFEFLQQLLPLDPETTPSWPLLLVKLTYFQCGGMAIGLCISHKLADATSLSIFIQSWTAMARGESDLEASPVFAAAKFYPPANEAFKLPVDVQADKKTRVTKRFVFVASKIEELRVKAASDAVPRPTRVQSVTSLIWRCVAASSDASREKVLVQPANLRPMIPSLLSGNGNVIGNLFFSTMTFKGKGEIQLSETVKELQERAKELALLVQGEEGSIGTKLVGHLMGYASKLSNQNHEIHPVTSWCKLQFYYADFGWGSPVWVAGNVVFSLHNKTVLIDSKDGQGIEAWVTLHQEAMSFFEQNPDLLAFASPNA